jgi:hypothetical protein
MARKVCLHGLEYTSASFRALVQPIADHEVVRLDFAGHPARLK